MIPSSLTHPGVLRDAGDTAGTLQRAERAAPGAPMSLAACRSGPGSGALLPAFPVPLRGRGQGRTGGSGAASSLLPRGEAAPSVSGLGPAVPCAALRGSAGSGEPGIGASCPLCVCAPYELI